MDIRETKYGIRTYSVASALLLIIYYLLDLKLLNPWEGYIPFYEKANNESVLNCVNLFVKQNSC